MTAETHNTIVAARKALGLSQWQMGYLCRISQPYYGNIETGRAIPPIELAQKIGKILSISWELFYNEDKE